MESLTVALVQMESVVGDAAANARKMGEWVARAADAGAGLVVFPECCLTGYSAERAARIAVSADSLHVSDVEELARSHGIAVGYGFVEREELSGQLYVSYAIVPSHAGAQRLFYRKTHLGASECEAFSAGCDLPVADIAGVCVGVHLCWEAHIPDISCALRAKGAKLVVVPHASPLGGARRLDAWSRYLPARAWDNGMYVAACNAVQHDAAGRPCGGGIAVYNPHGDLVASNGESAERMEIVTIGGTLPREAPAASMRGISYYDRRRPELY